jgi:hypothetical protein
VLNDDLTNDQVGAYTRRIGTIQHFRWLRGMVAAVLVLNLCDAILTVIVVSTGRAKEANPFMADLIEANPASFAIVKMALVSLGTVLLWRYRKRPAAVFSIFVAFMAYYLVLLHHLSSWDMKLIEKIVTIVS